MSPYPGGSAWAMARDVGDGYVLLTDVVLRRFGGGELDLLAFELDRRLRDVRAELPPPGDVPAARERNRRLQRLAGALGLLQSYRQRRPQQP